MDETEVPPWTTEHGRDGAGPWASFALDGVTQRLRWITPGATAMGSPETAPWHAPQEGPARVEEVAAGFWLAETPVTEALWAAVMRAPLAHTTGPRRPVTCVSWDDAQRFLEALQERVAGLAARLPTEREWERACRAGTSTATWAGDRMSDDGEAPELDAIAWYAANSGGGTRDVAGKAPNPWGLYDMLGNVWEWCADAYAPWRAKPKRVTAKTKEVPHEKTLRTIRGGSWGSRPDVVRAAMRGAFLPHVRDASVGLRLAVDGSGR
jgi:sulfatase modifying factor 1